MERRSLVEQWGAIPGAQQHLWPRKLCAHAPERKGQRRVERCGLQCPTRVHVQEEVEVLMSRVKVVRNGGQ